MNTGVNNTSRLTFMGVMLALTIVFVLATAIPSFAVSVAVVLFLPTILTGIVYGPAAGAVMGGCAGIATLIRALLMPLSPLDYFFINPLVSVLPRIFIGVVSYYVFVLVHNRFKANPIWSAAIAAGMGIMTNTLLVVGMLYLVNGQVMVEAMGAGFTTALITLFTTNGVIELFSAVIIVPIIYGAYCRYAKKKRM